MDILNAVTLMVILVFIGVTMFMANQEEARGKTPNVTRFLLLVIIITMFLLAPSAFYVTTQQDYTGTQVDLYVVLGLIGAGTAASLAMLLSMEFRRRFQRLMGGMGYFNATSIVHVTAFVLMIALLLWGIVPFILQGGIEGYERALQESGGVAIGEVILNAVLEVTMAFLGVGLYIRRTLPKSLERLGLRFPTVQDIVVGASAGVGLLVFQILFVIAWLTISPESIDLQGEAPDLIARSFATLPLALILATCAAVGEEILIRGALQPVFGIIGSSVFFALLHTQYFISPSLLFIFIVSLALGLLRNRISTNAAIAAHFVFNFIPLALLASGITQ